MVKKRRRKVGGTYPVEWKEFIRKKEKEVEDWQKKFKKSAF